MNLRRRRTLIVAAGALFVLGLALIAATSRVSAAHDDLAPQWTWQDPAPPVRFRVAAFPAGLQERGVPDRAILLTLEEWNDEIGVVRWTRAGEEVAVQRRLLRVDLPEPAARPLIDALNREASRAGAGFSRVEYGAGERSDERRLVVVGLDGRREAFEYRADESGRIEPRAILADGDNAPLLRGGVVAIGAVVSIWAAVLCMIAWAVLAIAASRRA